MIINYIDYFIDDEIVFFRHKTQTFSTNKIYVRKLLITFIYFY